MHSARIANKSSLMLINERAFVNQRRGKGTAVEILGAGPRLFIDAPWELPNRRIYVEN